MTTDTPKRPILTLAKKVEVSTEENKGFVHFYLVWSPDSSKSPKRRHPSFKIARDEAKRLSKIYPQQEFYVLKTMYRSMPQAPICAKIAYKTLDEANSMADTLSKNKRVQGRGSIKPYVCEHCQKFHLTSRKD